MCLPYIIEKNLDVIFCGTGAGIISGNKCHYYSNVSHNKFWALLHKIGLTDGVTIMPENDWTVLKYHIGLADLSGKPGLDNSRNE